MSLYKVINTGALYTTVGNVPGYTWPSDEIREATIGYKWGTWYPTIDLIGKCIWKFKNTCSKATMFILMTSDDNPRYFIIGERGCELIQPKNNNFTKKYLELSGE